MRFLGFIGWPKEGDGLSIRVLDGADGAPNFGDSRRGLGSLNLGTAIRLSEAS